MLEHFRSLLAPGGTAYVSTPNVLTLAPPGAAKSATRGTCKEYRAAGVPRAVRDGVRRRSSCSACSTPASSPSTPSRSSSAGTRPPAPAAHQAVLRPVHAGDRHQRLRAASRASSTRRSTSSRSAGREPRRPRAAASSRSSCTPTCPTSRASAPGRSARSGCGRRSRRRYLPLLDVLARAPITLSLTPVLCDQLEAPGVDRALPDVPARDPPGVAPARHRAAPRARRATLVAELERSAAEYAAAADRLDGCPAACSARWRRTRPGPRPRPTRCCRCSPPTPASRCRCRPGSRRTAAASATGPAASGCPSARTRRGLTSRSRRRACAPRASS